MRVTRTTLGNLASNPKLRGRILAPCLSTVNRLARHAVVGDADVIVSLTSYGRRVGKVHNAIEAIGRGSVRPRRLILWLHDDDLVRNPPKALRRLRDRGLEIRSTPNYFPHKKYYPYICSRNHHIWPLVTADDDIAYPVWWLERLIAAHDKERDSVWCYRGHQITFDLDGRIQPYGQWVPCASTAPSPLTVPTGTSGVLYPPALLNALRQLGTAFMDLAPYADDLWLHRASLRNGTAVRQVFPSPVHFPLFPFDQRSSLTRSNRSGGGNDRVIADIYSREDLSTLRAASIAGMPS